MHTSSIFSLSEKQLYDRLEHTKRTLTPDKDRRSLAAAPLTLCFIHMQSGGTASYEDALSL